MNVAVRRLDPSRRQDFFTLHSDRNGCGWCQCVAWWVPTWTGWGERTTEMNQALRESLFERGQDDGYLLYANGEPAGWAQVGLRDRLEKLVGEYGCGPDPRAWAVTCFLLAPQVRGRGLARRLLEAILSDLPERGARSVEAYPRRGVGLPAEDVWTAPEALFLEAGFLLIQDHPRRPRYRKELADEASMTGRV